MALGRLARALFDCLLPPGCPACGRPPGAAGAAGAVFCPACRELLLPPPSPACPRCGGPAGPAGAGQPCPACRAHPPAFDAARALFLHAGPPAEAVRALKYRRRLDAGAALGRLLRAEAPRAFLAPATILAPVPLHRWRLLKRGFNQAAVLFAPLARELGLAHVPDLLRRVRPTRPQVGLSPPERQANVQGAFAVNPRHASRLAGATVCLVDDVFTTGATLDQCARALKAQGAGRVLALTLTRAAGHLVGGREDE